MIFSLDSCKSFGLFVDPQNSAEDLQCPCLVLSQVLSEWWDFQPWNSNYSITCAFTGNVKTRKNIRSHNAFLKHLNERSNTFSLKRELIIFKICLVDTDEL